MQNNLLRSFEIVDLDLFSFSTGKTGVEVDPKRTSTQYFEYDKMINEVEKVVCPSDCYIYNMYMHV